MDEFLAGVLQADPQMAAARQRDATTTFLQTMDRVYLQQYTEVGQKEATAAKSLHRGRAPQPNESYDE